MDFNEEFLHFIWQFRLFKAGPLHCVDGETLQVLHPGMLNQNAGPDFSGAKLIIDQTKWVGHVEIHLKSSDWLLHQHQNDTAYEAVILHVVYRHDVPVYRSDGSRIPVLVLDQLFSKQLLVTYKELLTAAYHFPCQQQIGSVDPLIVQSFLCRLIVERLEQKSEEVYQKLDQYCGDWEQTFYCFIARSFGFKVNAVPFEVLANALPQQVFSKHKDNPLQIEALLFGQAGFLNQEFTEVYPMQLQREYAFLKNKYGLVPMDCSLWKFLRMRPQNFPTVRLAQFAALVCKSSHLFSKILLAESHAELLALFDELPVNEYWQTHYHFNKQAEQVVVQPGMGSVNNIIINAVCLFLFCYGKYTDQQILIERALDFLENMPAENNVIVAQYTGAGIQINSAFVSQAVLQLNKYYCNQKKCLNCGIGIKILRK